MNFRDDVTVVTVMYWKERLGLLQHQFKRFEQYGRPKKHIIWLNTLDEDVLAVCQAYASTNNGTYIIQSENIYDLPAYDKAANLIDTPYMLGMSQDICVRRDGWMEEFEAIAPFDLAGIEGEDARSLQSYFNFDTFHVRGGMMAVCIEPFKQVGRYMSGAENSDLPWPVYEVGLSVKFRMNGLSVKSLVPFPMWDYDTWGDRALKGLKEFSDEQLDLFDERFHIERAPSVTFGANVEDGIPVLSGFVDTDRKLLHLTRAFRITDENWDWDAICGSGMIGEGAAGLQSDPLLCNKCSQQFAATYQ